MAFSIDTIAIAPWKYWAQVSPFSIALETSKEQVNWQQLTACVDLYSRYLQQQGVSSGDVVTLVGKNQVETLWFYLAAQQIGAIAALTMPQPFDALSGKLTTLYSQPNNVLCGLLMVLPVATLNSSYRNYVSSNFRLWIANRNVALALQTKATHMML